jgi:transcriptional regulator with XRE-family HTH domain
MTMKLILKKVLKESGLSAYRLSEKSGISKQLLSNWSRFGSRSITFDHLVRMKKATGLSWSKLGDLIEQQVESDSSDD